MLKRKGRFSAYLRRIRSFSSEFFSNRLGVFGFVVLVAFAAVVAVGPRIAPYNPLSLKSIGVGPPFAPPSWIRLIDPSVPESDTFGLLGTDEIGRDIFSQVVYGSRISLFVGFSAALISITVGTIVGLVAGYFGGILDQLLMRATDILLTIPTLPLMIVLAAILGSSIFNLVVVIGALGWQSTARIIRSQVLSLKESPFVESSRAIGSSDFRIIFRILLPNVAPLVYVNAALTVANVIFLEAGLSFLGLGDPNHISWGLMLFYANEYMAAMRGAWWYVVPPGLCILLVVMSFIFVGHALDDVLNPRLRRR